ncbi:hypothetical protein T05_6206 [Trichinella murrelli]|uniref:Uncharacterized protein n=1 Tax=Trichinella murrelli TaxID=144512 RepID=A0A0V0TJB3_9BILA|nr:hypothetical protein T05_6206 [Trichinella murrelli]
MICCKRVRKIIDFPERNSKVDWFCSFRFTFETLLAVLEMQLRASSSLHLDGASKCLHFINCRLGLVNDNKL